jgi:hypothetical protein
MPIDVGVRRRPKFEAEGWSLLLAIELLAAITSSFLSVSSVRGGIVNTSPAIVYSVMRTNVRTGSLRGE